MTQTYLLESCQVRVVHMQQLGMKVIASQFSCVFAFGCISLAAFGATLRRTHIAQGDTQSHNKLFLKGTQSDGLRRRCMFSTLPNFQGRKGLRREGQPTSGV